MSKSVLQVMGRRGVTASFYQFKSLITECLSPRPWLTSSQMKTNYGEIIEC